MRHKQVPATTAPTTDRGEFSALAATYSIDRQNEQICPGAFAKTLAKWQKLGRQIPLHWNHEGSAASVIGSVNPATARETDDGLYVEGQLDLENSEVAREAWRSMKANRVALSFGFMVTDDRLRSDGVRELRGIDLFEISITPGPANPDTRILTVKAATNRDPALDRESRAIAEILARPLEEVEAKATKARGPIQVEVFDC